MITWAAPIHLNEDDPDYERITVGADDGVFYLIQRDLYENAGRLVISQDRGTGWVELYHNGELKKKSLEKTYQLVIADLPTFLMEHIL